MKNKNFKINYNDANAWKLPAAMYFNKELKPDSIIVHVGFASDMLCCTSGSECHAFNEIDAVAGYINRHLIYDNITYNILRMEYSTTCDECDDEAFLMDIQDIWNRNVGAIGLLEYVEQNHSDRWDEKLTELKSHVETVCKNIDKFFESKDEKEKKNILLDTQVLFNKFFNEICRWSFDLHIYFGTEDFVRTYEKHFDVPIWLCDKQDVWDDMKSNKFKEEHATIIETLIRSMNE